MLGLIAPSLQDAFLVRQMTNKVGQTLRATIGQVIPTDAVAAFASDEDAIAFLRTETEKLGSLG